MLSSIELLPSAARTATPSIQQQVNSGASGVILILNVTAASGTGGLIPQVRVYDAVSAGHDILHSIPVPVTATGTYQYHVYPGADYMNSSIQFAASLNIGKDWSVVCTHRDGSSYTYSLSAILVP